MKPAHTPRTIVVPAAWGDIQGGEYYRESLEQALLPWWPKIFGFHLLKIGALSASVATTGCSISHQVNVAPDGKDLQVIADPYQLPFAEKSVDACLLAQTLAYASDPHRIVREVDRVLIDDGWLLLSGFNPLSLLGLGKLVPGLRRRQPYCSRMFTQMRLMDWLSLLNYEVIYHTGLHTAPWRKGKGQIRSHLPMLGCLTVIVARKRTIPLTFISLRHKLRKPSLRRGTVGATRSCRTGATEQPD